MPETQQELKYTIVELLDQVPKGEYDQLVDSIIQDLDVTPYHFKRMIAYKKDSPNEIRASNLKTIAEHLGVTVDDLFAK